MKIKDIPFFWAHRCHQQGELLWQQVNNKEVQFLRILFFFFEEKNYLCCSLKILLTSAANRKASKKGKRSNKLSSLGFDIQVGKAIPFSENN
jgi:hypothetical protein